MTGGTVTPIQVKQRLPDLHRAVLDIVGIINGPERDEAILTLAGLNLERALFPLLVLVEKYGPIGVVDLAGRVGRDYTTVSRQLTRLEKIGLVQRNVSGEDRRTRQVVVTGEGKTATTAVDQAREAMLVQTFKDWSADDFAELVMLLGRFAENLGAK